MAAQRDWVKSSRSNPTANCVEVADLPEFVKSGHSAVNNCVAVKDLAGGGKAVRDSKNPLGPELVFTRAEWAAFVRGVQDGEPGLL